MPERGCAQFDAVVAEVALGVADAWEQSAAMHHVERCARCRQGLVRLSDAADGLLDLVPPVDPPPAFESRVLASLVAAAGTSPAGAATPAGAPRTGPQPPQMAARRPLRRAAPSRRRVLQVAAVAVAAAVVAAGGWTLGARASGSRDHRSGTSAPATAPAGGHVVRASLVADGRAVGDVVLRTGRDPWISMAVREPPGSAVTGAVTCRLRLRGDASWVAGTFPLTGGDGYWAAPVPANAAVTGAQLVDAAGRVVAAAVLPASGPASRP